MPKTLPKRLEGIVKRYEGNPIITRKDISFAVSKILNAGSIKHKNKYLLLLRAQTMDTRSYLVKATSKDGINFNISKRYTISPSREFKLDDRGVEDPRITKIDGTYYIAHTAYSDDGAVIGIISTKDFRKFARHGIATPPENKDGGLLPEKIKLPRSGDKEFFLYHRPSATGAIWCCSSPDLEHWGHQHVVMRRGQYNRWSDKKVGLGAVPIKTEKGWLEIYHGVMEEGNNNVYRLGAALFDLEEPWKVIRASKSYILAPEEEYEMMGGVSYVVFSCGVVPESNGDVKIYYGAADSSICLATAKLDELIEVAEKY